MENRLLRNFLCLFLFLPLLTGSLTLAQDATVTPEPKTPLPVPTSPVVTLESDIQDDVETGEFVIVSSDTSVFDNAEFVEWLAANESSRDEAEGTVAPSAAGTIRVSAEDLSYEDGNIISFSLTGLAALNDPVYADSPSLIFCYPVYESCRDPKTLIRSLPPPLDATVSLVTPTPEPPPDDETGKAQTSDGAGTFEVQIPLRGKVINNASGFDWTARNSDGTLASGTEALGSDDAQAQAVDPFETIRFGADLIDYQVEEVVRIVVRARAEEGSSFYVDSHPVAYYFCQDPNDQAPNCAARWVSVGGGGGDDGGGDDGGGDGGGGVSGGEICLNTDAAAPIKVCANADYSSYTLYGVFQDSSTTSLASVSSTSGLYESDAAANTNLASGTNSATAQPYTVSYDGAGTMTLSTFYADKGPDVDKPYIITIDTHNTVRYVQW